MVEDNLYLIDIHESGTFDLVSKRTIHEVAHQWWGMLLTPKNVEGGAFITEGFTKYTEGVVLEKLYGMGALWELNKQANLRYFRGRSFGTEKEPPVYLEDGQSYLAYGKDILVLLSLRDLIGEETLNEVLRSMITKHSDNHEYEAHTLEFLDELYSITPQKYHQVIDDWMKKVIRYDLSVGEISHTKLLDGSYQMELEVKAERFETLDNGDEKIIGIDEPIKIGFFAEHPKNLRPNQVPIYLESHQISSQSTVFKIQVDQLPRYISIDPFLTRVDKMYNDNVKELN